MFNLSTLRARFITGVILSFIVFPTLVFAGKPVAPSLSTDLQALVSEGNDINTLLSSIALTRDNSCTELGSATAAVESFIASIEGVSGSLSAPITLDSTSLDALDDLTLISAGMASSLPILSGDITSLSFGSDLADITAAMDAMLKLSDDIGIMADRILEMADKILVMSDNIGLMADRILLTQQIQSSNIALTQSAMLTTQQNMIALSATVDTSAYNLPLSALIDTGNQLSLDMTGTQLTETSMSTELAEFESRVNLYLNSVMTLFATLNSDSAVASYFINSDTLTMLGDLSVINAALASALDSYAQAVNTLAPGTDIAILTDAINSMLRLAADIGVMGNRIVEMGDNINIMADNIGVMAARIVATQTLQQSNLDLTQANLTSAQITTVSIIAAFGL